MSDPAGSGGFWSFGFQSELNGERYGFMCSNYDELYFRDGNRDVDNAAGYLAIQAPGTRVRLGIRNDRRDYVEQLVERTMQKIAFIEKPTLEEYFESDGEARNFAASLIHM